MKYLADLREETIVVVKRDSSASVNVVLTPRNELSDSTQSKSNVLATHRKSCTHVLPRRGISTLEETLRAH